MQITSSLAPLNKGAFCRGKTKRLTPALVRGETQTYGPRFHPAYGASPVARARCNGRPRPGLLAQCVRRAAREWLSPPAGAGHFQQMCPSLCAAKAVISPSKPWYGDTISRENSPVKGRFYRKRVKFRRESDAPAKEGGMLHVPRFSGGLPPRRQGISRQEEPRERFAPGPCRFDAARAWSTAGRGGWLGSSSRCRGRPLSDVPAE